MASDNPEAQFRNLDSTVLSYRTAEKRGSQTIYLAVATFVCGLLFIVVSIAGCAGENGTIWLLLPLLAPAAIVLGMVARKTSDDGQSGRSLATTAIWIGSIETFLLIVGMILLPTLGAPTERTSRVKCSSNLRQIGQGLVLYANDNEGRLPKTLDLLVTDADLDIGVFVCPSSNEDAAPGATNDERLQNFRGDSRRHCSFIYLGTGANLRSLPRHFILAHDRFDNHEKEGLHVLYADGEVEWLSKGQAEHVIAETNAGFNPPRPRGGTSSSAPVTRPAAPPPTASSPPP